MKDCASRCRRPAALPTSSSIARKPASVAGREERSAPLRQEQGGGHQQRGQRRRLPGARLRLDFPPTGGKSHDHSQRERRHRRGARRDASHAGRAHEGAAFLAGEAPARVRPGNPPDGAGVPGSHRLCQRDRPEDHAEPQRGDADGRGARRLESGLPAEQRAPDAGEQPRTVLPRRRAALRRRRVAAALADAGAAPRFQRAG